jgi:hypothetical protein
MTGLGDTELSPFADAQEHLLAELDRLELLLRRRAILLRDAGLVTDSDFRGLYVADEHIERIPLDAVDRPMPPAAASLADLAALSAERNLRRLELGPELPLPRLIRLTGLSPLEADALLLAVGAELDLRWERLFAYVQDDVTRRRPTVQLALDLLCASREERLHGRALLTDGSLVREGLVLLVDDAEKGTTPVPARALAASERVLGYLLAVDGAVDRSLRGCMERLPAASLPPSGELEAAASALAAGVAVVIHGHAGAGGRDMASALGARIGRATVAIDLRGTPVAGLDLATVACLEARLQDAAVYLEGTEDLSASALGELFRRFSETDLPLIVRADGPLPDPHPHRRFALHLRVPNVAARRERWLRVGRAGGIELDPSAADELASKLSLDEAQTAAVLRDAARRAGRGVQLRTAHLDAAARAAAGGALGSLVQRLQPRWGFGDIVLPARQLATLHEIAARVRNARVVHDEWGFRPAGIGGGLSVLFHGASGTGKTMAAEVLATALGLELYRIDLATVVSKYIGETEKNLRQVFAAAETINGILLFDEADALFGRRSQVKDAHDRYANIETAYLLGEFESYCGLAVLTTNLVGNLDDAFTRRIQLSIEFPMPGGDSRERLWKLSFPPGAPLADDLDLRVLAQRIEVSGAVIRNASLAAAFAAANDGTAITNRHLVRAVAGELEKLGRPPSRGEFGELYAVISGPSPAGGR